MRRESEEDKREAKRRKEAKTIDEMRMSKVNFTLRGEYF